MSKEKAKASVLIRTREKFTGFPPLFSHYPEGMPQKIQEKLLKFVDDSTRNVEELHQEPYFRRVIISESGYVIAGIVGFLEHLRPNRRFKGYLDETGSRMVYGFFAYVWRSGEFSGEGFPEDEAFRQMWEQYIMPYWKEQQSSEWSNTAHPVPFEHSVNVKKPDSHTVNEKNLYSAATRPGRLQTVNTGTVQCLPVSEKYLLDEAAAIAAKSSSFSFCENIGSQWERSRFMNVTSKTEQQPVRRNNAVYAEQLAEREKLEKQRAQQPAGKSNFYIIKVTSEKTVKEIVEGFKSACEIISRIACDQLSTTITPYGYEDRTLPPVLNVLKKNIVIIFMTSPSDKIELLYKNSNGKRSDKTLFSVLKDLLERDLGKKSSSVEVWDQYNEVWAKRKCGLYPCNAPESPGKIVRFRSPDAPHDKGKRESNATTDIPVSGGTQSGSLLYRTGAPNLTGRSADVQRRNMGGETSESENYQEFMRSVTNQTDEPLEGVAETKERLKKIPKNKCGLFSGKKDRSDREKTERKRRDKR